MDNISCSECNGSRLRKESLNFKINGKNIAALSSMDVIELTDWFAHLEEDLSDIQRKIASEIIKEVRTRLCFLVDVGLTYLSLNRSSKSLSGGEAQRIRLATQIGSQLVGVLYILDEPSIGLHQRDNKKLINSLIKLKDLGNSIIVVEHDKEMISMANYVIDIGPAAGKHGGEIVSEGTPEETLIAYQDLQVIVVRHPATAFHHIDFPKEAGEVTYRLSVQVLSGLARVYYSRLIAFEF